MAYDPNLDITVLKVNVPDTDLILTRSSYDGGEEKIGIYRVTARGIQAAGRLSPVNFRRVWATVAATPALWADPKPAPTPG